MVDMMVADTARKPLQDPRQFEERASLEGLGDIIPFRVAFPINAFKLMLNIEQIDAGAGRDG